MTTTQIVQPVIIVTPEPEADMTGAAYEQVIGRALTDGRITELDARRLRWHATNKLARQSWPACKHGHRTGGLDSDGSGTCMECWQERRQPQEGK